MIRTVIFFFAVLTWQIGFSQSATPLATKKTDDVSEAYSYSPPKSAWREQEKQKAREMLSRKRINILVTPFQVDGHALDATARSLMTMSLSRHLAELTGRAVADPGLVEKAFGSGVRSISREEIETVHKITGAETIVLGFVGHDRNNSMSLRIEKVLVKNGVPDWASKEVVKNYSNISFDDIALPYFKFLEIRSDITNALFAVRSGSRKKSEETPGHIYVPKDISAIDEALSESATKAAYYLQFLAQLYPAEPVSRASSRLYERSVVLVEQLPDDSPDKSILLSRAFAGLDRRPAAIEQLKGDKRPEARALHAFLDGSLPRCEEATSEIESPLLAFLARLSLESLKRAYDQSMDATAFEVYALQYPFWATAIAQVKMNLEEWDGRSPMVAKIGLDSQFPLPKFNLQSVIEAKILVGEMPDELEITQLAFSHIEVIQSQNIDRHFSIARDAALDLWIDHLVATAIKRIKHRNIFIGSPDEAVAVAQELEPLFAGQPAFTFEMGYAQWSLAKRRSGSESRNLKENGYENIRRGAIWQLGQARNTAFYLPNSRQFFPGSESLDEAERAKMFFGSDWPNLPDWGGFMLTRREDSVPVHKHCIKYTITNMQCFRNLYSIYSSPRDGDPEAAAQLLKEIEHRMVGHPQRIMFLSDVHRKAGDFKAAEEVLMEAVDMQAVVWDPYERLAIWLGKKGQSEEASKLALRYPKFADPNVSNTVELSNDAYELGSMFYWAGDYQSARPLYEVASGYQNGSAAGMSSEVRLALMEQNYVSAIEQTVRRVRRYGSYYAYRDLIALLVMMGDSGSARTVLDGLTAKMGRPEIWDGAVVLHRASGLKRDEITEWAYSDELGGYEDSTEVLADRYVFLSEVTDRKPPPDIGQLFPPYAEPVVRPAPAGTAAKPWRYPAEKRYVLAKSAVGLAAIYSKDYEAAWAAFDSAEKIDRLGEFLPYYVLASLKTGRTTKLETHLKQLERQKSRSRRFASSDVGAYFDYYLSLAFVRAAEGNHAEAIDYLVQTNADVLHTRTRAIFTRYQVIEAAEILFEDTDHDPYRQFALDLARKNTIIEPSNSWAHAFVAKFTDNAAERDLAAARALYLDPDSYRANELDESVVRRAKAIASNGFPLPDDNI